MNLQKINYKILSNHPFFVNLDNFYNKTASYAHKTYGAAYQNPSYVI